jgi:UDP-GlcNAc:undecaprenyl-phosphate GlcNAc-1-phosphate transferase
MRENSTEITLKWTPLHTGGIILLLLLTIPPVREWFHDRGGVRWVHILLFASLVSYCVTPFVKYAAFKWNVLDHPDPRKVHNTPTPLMGGIGIYIAFLTAIMGNVIFSRELIAIVIGSTIVFISGLLDDIMKLSSRLRLGLQLIAVMILAVNGISISIFEPTWSGILLNSGITCFWIIGLTNTANFFDGMDGLTTGLCILFSFFIGVVAFQTYQPFLGWLAVAVMGGCLGFLPGNFRSGKPAEIFLGDSGSNFLGFTLASIAVMGEWSEKSTVSSLGTPVLIFSVMIYDMIYITVSRILTGKVHNVREWLDYVGKDHLHHRLADLLRSRKKSVLFILLLSFTLGFNALLLRDSDTITAIILLSQAFCILVVITILEIAGNKNGKDAVPDARRIEDWRNPKLLLSDVDRPYNDAVTLNNRTCSPNHAGRSLLITVDNPHGMVKELEGEEK